MKPIESVIRVLRSGKFIFSVAWALYLVVSLGLATGVGIGIADNGDGVRVTAPAGLNPETDDGTMKGKGYVVTEFTSAANPEWESVSERLETLHYPTANAYLLTLMGVWSADREVSLFTLGWLYLLVGLSIIWLLPRSAGLVPLGIAMGALALAPYSRWVISAYADTPGFFGFAAALGALAALTAKLSRRDMVRVALLFWWGVFLIAASKAAYIVVIPFLLIGFVALYLISQRRLFDWRTLSALGLVTVIGAIVAGGMVNTQFTSDDREQSNRINNHHFVMSIVVPYYDAEIVEEAIPPQIAELSPEGYWPRRGEWNEVEGWTDTMGDNRAMLELRLALFGQPALLGSLLSTALNEAVAPDLDYLVANTWTEESLPPLAIVPHLLYALTTGATLVLLSPLGLPGVPIPFIVLTFLGAAVFLLVRRHDLRRFELADRARSVFVLLTVSGLVGGALAGAAIVGDGYGELAKHLITSSYLFTVYVVSLITLGILGIRMAVLSRRTDGSSKHLTTAAVE